MLKLISVKFLVGVVLVAALAAPRIAMGATGPGIGIYVVSSYVVSATATNGGTCGAAPGDYLTSYFYYPGPAKTGAVERHSINGSEENVIQELDFPVTPAAGVDTWSGRISGTTPTGKWIGDRDVLHDVYFCRYEFVRRNHHLYVFGWSRQHLHNGVSGYLHTDGEVADTHKGIRVARYQN